MPERVEARRRRPWLLTPGQALGVFAWGVALLFLWYVPPGEPGLWRQLSWGEEILATGEVPIADPVLDLARGMRVVDGEWLSQAALAAVYRAFGAEGLSLLFAVVVALALGLWWWVLRRVSGGGATALAMVALVALSWRRLSALRAETFGWLCFAALLWLLVRYAGSGEGEGTPERPWAAWIGVPLVLALWANLHASFAIGLAALACFLIGGAIDSAFRRRSVAGLWANQGFGRRLVLFELGLAASVLNPYGIDLLLHLRDLSSNPNLGSLPEFQPLALAAPGGREFALSVLALLFLFRHSRRPAPAGPVLLLLALGAFTAIRASGLLWYGPVFALVAAPHLGELLARRRREGGSRRPAASPVWGALAVIGLWVAFAFSPAGTALLGGPRRQPDHLLGRGLPVAALAHLRADLPAGRFLAPLGWADWLAREGGPGLRPLVGAGAELIPAQVWEDHLSFERAESGWTSVLDRYGIDAVILERFGYPAQAGAMRDVEGWRLEHDDSRSWVFFRESAIRLHDDPEGPGGEQDPAHEPPHEPLDE